MSSSRHRIDLAAFTLLFAAGMGTLGALLQESVGLALGTTSAAGATALGLGAAFFVLGSVLSPRLGSIGPRGLGAHLVLLAAAALALSFVGGSARTIVVAFGSIDAGTLSLTLTRFVAGTVVVAPVALISGSAVTRAVQLLGEGARAARTAQLFAPGAALGVGAAMLARSPGRVATEAPVAAAVLFLALAVSTFYSRGAPAETSRRDPDVPEPLGGARSGLAIGFALAALPFLASRAFAFVFAYDFPALSPTVPLFAFSFAIAAFMTRFFRLPRGPEAGAVATGVVVFFAAGAALWLSGRFDEMPVRWAAAVEGANGSPSIAAAVRIAAPAIGSLGALLGVATALLLGALPPGRAERLAWLTRVAAGASVGAIVGSLAARLPIPELFLEGTLRAAAVIAALVAAGAIAARGLRTRAALLAAVGVFAVAGLAATMPAPDRTALLPEPEGESLLERAQIYRLAVEAEDAAHSVAVKRRGSSRHVFVDGRFDLAFGTDRKTPGMLAHLPLMAHPEPKRALVLGAGTGQAIAAARSHPLDRIDCFVASSAFRETLPYIGRETRAALADPRVVVSVGDPADLLARAEPYDVILSRPSGEWSSRAADVSHREFLRLASSRLGDPGVYCQLVASSTLTKAGFETLLSTFADVFPRVELWSGQRGDLLILAKKTSAPHDFERVLDVYRHPAAAASCDACWIREPLTLLSHYLVSSATVRGISAAAPVATRRNGELLGREAERRAAQPTVDPVPGLVQLRDDVVDAFENVPAQGFRAGLDRAIRARDLERAADARQDERYQFDTRIAIEAAKGYQDALDLNPEDGGVRRALAMLRTKLGVEYSIQQSFQSAHGNLRRAAEVDTTYATAFLNLGRLLIMSEDFEYAASVLREAVRLEPDNESHWNVLGSVFKRQANYADAKPFFEKAVEVNPADAGSAAELVDCIVMIDRGRESLETGLAILDHYLKLEPDNEDLLYRRERLFFELEKIAREVEPRS